MLPLRFGAPTERIGWFVLTAHDFTIYVEQYLLDLCVARQGLHLNRNRFTGLKHCPVRWCGEGDVGRETGPYVVCEQFQVKSDVVTLRRIQVNFSGDDIFALSEVCRIDLDGEESFSFQ